MQSKKEKKCTETMTWKTAVEKKLYEFASKYTYVKCQILIAVSL